MIVFNDLGVCAFYFVLISVIIIFFFGGGCFLIKFYNL